MDIYERPDHLFDEEPKMYDHLDWSGNEVFFGEMMPGEGDEAADEEASDGAMGSGVYGDDDEEGDADDDGDDADEDEDDASDEGDDDEAL